MYPYEYFCNLLQNTKHIEARYVQFSNIMPRNSEVLVRQNFKLKNLWLAEYICPPPPSRQFIGKIFIYNSIFSTAIKSRSLISYQSL